MAGGAGGDLRRMRDRHHLDSLGEAREALPVPFQGEPLEIGFNPEFLRDGLEAVESGDVLLKLISPLRPGLIQAADGSGFQYLLMPIRLNV